MPMPEPVNDENPGVGETTAPASVYVTLGLHEESALKHEIQLATVAKRGFL